VTAALVEQGVDPARLVLVEFDPEFCLMLKKRFPAANVVQGDAHNIKDLLGGQYSEAAAVVSGLPLRNKPHKVRERLLNDAFALLAPGAPFVQFTYVEGPPIRATATKQKRILRNVPPAQVWLYRRDFADSGRSLP
jgi:phosphatidylethanolamine/phosphatidyl-N-methylethanolamine N-methyltransferase